MEIPKSNLDLSPNLIIGNWEGKYYKVNVYSGEIEPLLATAKFNADFTGEGNIIKNFYGNSAVDQFKWFPFGDAIEIIIKINDHFSNIPLLLFKCDEGEMVFHLGASCILKKK